MPRYFICEAGPMGGCSIVGVADTSVDVLRLMSALMLKEPNRELFAYERLYL